MEAIAAWLYESTPRPHPLTVHLVLARYFGIGPEVPFEERLEQAYEFFTSR